MTTKRKYLLPCLLLGAIFGMPSPAQTRIIPQITRPGSDFVSEVYLVNLSDEPVDYVLDGYDGAGGLFGQASGTVGAGETLIQTAETLFGDGHAVTFVKVAEHPDLVTYVINTSRSTGHATLFWETEERSTRWQVYPGADPTYWDGLILLNGTMTSAATTLEQFDGAGNLLSQSALDLEPDSRLVALWSALFTPQAGSHYRISSDQPLVSAGLRGNFATNGLGASRLFSFPEAILPRGTVDSVLAYLPRVGGGYVGRIVLANTAVDTANGQLTAFDAAGNALAVINVDLNGGEVTRDLVEDLFPGLTVSYARLSGPASLKGTVEMSSERAANEPIAHIHGQTEAGSYWLSADVEAQATIETLTLVSRSTKPLDLYFRKLDTEGAVVWEEQLTDNLAPNAQFLYVPNLPPGQGHLEVLGNGPFVLSGLQIDTNQDLWENPSKLLNRDASGFFLPRWPNNSTILDIIPIYQ